LVSSIKSGIKKDTLGVFLCSTVLATNQHGIKPSNDGIIVTAVCCPTYTNNNGNTSLHQIPNNRIEEYYRTHLKASYMFYQDTIIVIMIIGLSILLTDNGCNYDPLFKYTAN
jgi:hypothetical protein